MTKNQIWSQLAASIEDNDGNYQAGAYDVHFFAPWPLWIGSDGLNAPFDYSAKKFFLDRENYLFITDVGDMTFGQNFRNQGNFLWGAATYIMGVPQCIALLGANMNNLVYEPGTELDSEDDKYSIKLGRYYAKEMKWKTVYGGKNNIFRD